MWSLIWSRLPSKDSIFKIERDLLFRRIGCSHGLCCLGTGHKEEETRGGQEPAKALPINGGDFHVVLARAGCASGATFGESGNYLNARKVDCWSQKDRKKVDG